MYHWYEIADITLSDLPDGRLQETSVEGKLVGLLRRDDKLFAFAATCPHAGARLCDGWADARGHIVCPLHKYRFNPQNGYNSSGEGYKLVTYPVEIRESKIFIGLLT